MTTPKPLFIGSFLFLLFVQLFLLISCQQNIPGQTATLPKLTTTAVTSITSLTAISGGNISSDGGSTVTARGVCWGTVSGPVITGSYTTDGSGIGSFASNLTGLIANTTYYIRAYATNSAGTAFGNEISFTTPSATLTTLPTLTTTAVTSITSSTAISGGNINADGGSTVTARGVCWGTVSGPIATGSHTNDGSGIGSFASNITGLNANTTYYVRAYAINGIGTAFGNEVTFTTTPAATIITTAITAITQTTATSGGNITNNGGGPITARGVCWNTNTVPTIADSKTVDGTGTGIFASSITGLTGGTIYHIRAYATNSAGTIYGNEIIFTTLMSNPGTIPTVKICNQVWMLKNLDVSTYRNGDTIPEVQSAAAWAGLTSGAWCYYYNDPNNNAVYGKLYNWYAVNDPRGLAPTGYHIPTTYEWDTLQICLGGVASSCDGCTSEGTGYVNGPPPYNVGGQLKEVGTTHWGWMDGYNLYATNSSGWTALPGGDTEYKHDWPVGGIESCNGCGLTGRPGILGLWWTSTQRNSASAWFRYMFYNNGDVGNTFREKLFGLSVRCIKD